MIIQGLIAFCALTMNTTALADGKQLPTTNQGVSSQHERVSHNQTQPPRPVEPRVYRGRLGPRQLDRDGRAPNPQPNKQPSNQPRQQGHSTRTRQFGHIYGADRAPRD